jgi:hypothetical protein
VEHLARLERILSFIQHAEIAPEMSAADIELCTSVEQRLRRRGPSERRRDRVDVVRDTGAKDPNFLWPLDFESVASA